MFSRIYSALSSAPSSSQDRPDSGFYGSRESTMDVDGLASSLGSMQAQNGVRRGGIVLTAGIGTLAPLPGGQGIPGMEGVTCQVRPGVGVEHPVTRQVYRQNPRGDNNILGTITISNEDRRDQHSDQVAGGHSYGGISSTRPCHQNDGNHSHRRPASRPPQMPVTPEPPSMMNVIVLNHLNSNRSREFRLKTSASVDDLMAVIQKEYGVPPDQQRLLFAGKQFERGHTLQEYGVKEGSQVTLTGRLRGG